MLLTLVAAVLGCGLAVVGPAADAAASSSAQSVTPPSGVDPLQTVGDLVVRRLALAEPVAESKWLTGAPIDDPAREQAVIAAGVTRARGDGVDPALAERVLRDQIAASKLIQYALFTRWTHEPWSAPTTAPDLPVIRAQITQLGDAIVDGLAGVTPVATQPRCSHVVVAERHRTEPQLQPLQRKALRVAWSRFCQS